MKICQAMYRHTIASGSISGVLRKLATANSFTWASCYSWSREGQTSTTVFQKIRSVPHFLQPPAIDREHDSNAKMYANHMAGRDGANLKAHISSLAFPRKIPVRGRFSNAVFKHFPLEDFFSNQRESISHCPKSPFPSKTQNRQESSARASPTVISRYYVHSTTRNSR